MAKELGYADVDQMVDEVPPAKLAKWQAVAWLDGWGCDYQRTATICSTIWNAALLVCGCWRRVEEREWKTPADYLPSHLRDDKPKQKTGGGIKLMDWMMQTAGIKRN